MFKNKYDVVETNKMAMEDVASLIDGERVAATDLENGRLVVVDGDKYKYASSAEEEVFLVTTPERLYLPVGIDEFINIEGRKIRAVRIVLGDIFSTTAFDGEAEKGAKLVAGADGKLVAGEEGAMVFEIIGKRLLGKEIGVTVQRVK